jgi:hypothetical protein
LPCLLTSVETHNLVALHGCPAVCSEGLKRVYRVR